MKEGKRPRLSSFFATRDKRKPLPKYGGMGKCERCGVEITFFESWPGVKGGGLCERCWERGK